MDNILTLLLYLVIIVVGGILSVNRTKNKRKPVSNPSTAPKSGPFFDTSTRPAGNPLDEFLKRFEVEQTSDIEPPEPEPELEIDLIDRPQVVSLEEIVTKPEEEGLSIFSDKNNESSFIDYLDKDNMISSNEISDAIDDDLIEHNKCINLAEDIVKGIIYSEILKRKQF